MALLPLGRFETALVLEGLRIVPNGTTILDLGQLNASVKDFDRGATKATV